MRYEYRLERLPLRDRAMLIARLLDRLNELGRSGWRAVGMSLDAWSLRPWIELTLLLERERSKST